MEFLKIPKLRGGVIMKLRGILNALIGVWFTIAPWAIGFADQSGALSSSIIFGNHSDYRVIMGL